MMTQSTDQNINPYHGDSVGGKIRQIKLDYQMYKISKEEAEELAKPLLERVNTKQRELARKYNRRAKDFTLETFI